MARFIGTVIVDRKRLAMGGKAKPDGKYRYVIYVVAVLFILFWFNVMLDGFGWVID